MITQAVYDGFIHYDYIPDKKTLAVDNKYIWRWQS